MSVERPTFPVVRWREGYDTEEVDRAVEMVMTDLSLPEPRIARRDIETLRFTPVRRVAGYDMTAVDDWLDEVVAELDRRGGVRPPEPEPTPEPTPHPVAAPSVITDLGSPVQQDSERVRLLVTVALVVVVAVLLYVTFA